MTPLETLRHHVTGAIERGEKEAIRGIPMVKCICGMWHNPNTGCPRRNMPEFELRGGRTHDQPKA
jgi:hypothetical protein